MPSSRNFRLVQYNHQPHNPEQHDLGLRGVEPVADKPNTYKILSKRGAKAILTKLADMEWKPGVSAAYCAHEKGGHNFEIHSWDNELITDLTKALAQTIIDKRSVKRDTLGKHILPPKFNKYYGGGEYPNHCDSGFVGGLRADYACTLFLSAAKDYEGGELWVGGKLHKADQGYAVIYECGEPHHVTPVTAGERIAAVTWIQSYVQSPYKRKLLTKFQKFMASHKEDPAIFTQAGELYSALQKMWYD